jgi:hypothetical protein
MAFRPLFAMSHSLDLSLLSFLVALCGFSRRENGTPVLTKKLTNR